MKKCTKATLQLDGKSYELNVYEGTEGDRGIDISRLREQSGVIALDNGYKNTGSCISKITFVDGEKGILRYRGYDIEELAEKSSFIETAMLLIFGELPTPTQRQEFRQLLESQELLHEDILHHFEGFPQGAHPMAILSAVVNSLGSYHPELFEHSNEENFKLAAAKLMSKVRTIAAFAYRKSLGYPFIYPDPNLSYCVNFLHMMFSIPYRKYEPSVEEIQALSLFFMVHADHEQNCSCSTVRMVGSSGASLFASIAAGICALWGPLHGGANSAVIEMFDRICKEKITVKKYLEAVKKKQMRLMGFGHRIYKSFDPRAKILKKAADKLLGLPGQKQNRFMDIARELEAAALADSYFQERQLYPNVDFYSGLILRNLNIPVPMFPVMFAIGRMPGWIAHWWEAARDKNGKIHRPRQIYNGEPKRTYELPENRKGFQENCLQ